jgi:uncharacterized membrane protein
MKHIGKSGAALAAAAFTLAVSGTLLTKTATAAEGKIQCIGVNACKGHSECKTAKTGCNGQNACKGQGWVSATKKECTDLKGKIGDPV